MRKLLGLCALISAALASAAVASAAIEAPDATRAARDAASPTCTTPDPVHTYDFYHCYTPQQIRAAYGVDSLGDPARGTGLLGQGQTIVLVDSYGEPTGAADLQAFHDAF